jgi:4-hydroxysphinganine ceramide fatty acyl 2-hydroxylase
MKQSKQDYLAFKEGALRMPRHLAVREGIKGSALFRNPLLEKLTRTPIWIPQAMWVILPGIMLYFTFSAALLPVHTILLTVFTGILVWSFVEYVVHRFLYHTETNSDRLIRIQNNGHWIHHRFPKDPTRLAMPPAPALILSALFFGLFWLLLGPLAFAFWPGFMLGYDAYISFHYAQHVVKTPSYPPFRRLWKQHRIHHYKNPYVAYGVSTNLWDFVFGTMARDNNGKIIR